MPAGDQDIADLPADLPDNSDADLRWLLHNQISLDRRLGRVEDSVIFRILRAIGRTYRGRIHPSAGYRAWRERGGGTLPTPPVTSMPSFSLVTNARDLATATGDYVALVGEHHRLYPGALEHFAAAAPADLIYSDEEILDASGHPSQPIFKPDWSPVLLRSVDYLGGLAAVRRSFLAGSPDILSALRSRSSVAAVHVPAVLYATPGRSLPLAAPTTPPPDHTSLVSIVICTRTAHLLDSCLRAIRSQTPAPDYEVIVVHHVGGSTAGADAAAEQVIADHGARRIPYSQPFNFAAMNNRGAASARGPILLFLNDDVVPLQPDWLLRLASWLEDPAIGAAGAKLSYPGGALQHAGIAAFLIDGAWHPGRNMPPHPNWPWLRYTREVSAVTGACLALRTADFHRLGGFDAGFPVNFNDVDLCFRLRQENLAIIVDAEAQLRHDESRTRAGGSTCQERRRFFRKWANRLEQIDPFYTPHLAQNNDDLSLR